MKQHELIFPKPKGKVSFYLPDHWVFEAEESDMFMYYDPRNGSGTLRLHVITAEKKGETSDGFQDDFKRRTKEESGQFYHLENGNFVGSYSKSSKEQGQNIAVCFWNLAKPTPPFLVECVFSFTILEDQRKDKIIRSEIDMLEKTIKEAVISLK